MVFLKHNSLKPDIFFNPIFIPCFSESRFFRVQLIQDPGFSGSRLFMVQIIQGQGFSGSRFFRVGVQVLEVVLYKSWKICRWCIKAVVKQHWSSCQWYSISWTIRIFCFCEKIYTYDKGERNWTHGWTPHRYSHEIKFWKNMQMTWMNKQNCLQWVSFMQK